MQTIIEMAALANGAHRNQTGDFDTVPDGWIPVPDTLLETWNAAAPFAELTVTDGVLTGITATEKPAAEETTDTAPSTSDRLTALEEAVLGMMGVS